MIGRSSAVAAAAVALVGAGTGSSASQQRPTAAQIDAQTRRAVSASRANLVELRVVAPTRAYRLTVKVRDPAAYLEHRAGPLVKVMNRLTRLQWQFRGRRFTVLNWSGHAVLWLRELREPAGYATRFYVRPRLADCARDLDLDVEIDPDRAAPPCPAR